MDALAQARLPPVKASQVRPASQSLLFEQVSHTAPFFSHADTPAAIKRASNSFVPLIPTSSSGQTVETLYHQGTHGVKRRFG